MGFIRRNGKKLSASPQSFKVDGNCWKNGMPLFYLKIPVGVTRRLCKLFFIDRTKAYAVWYHAVFSFKLDSFGFLAAFLGVSFPGKHGPAVRANQHEYFFPFKMEKKTSCGCTCTCFRMKVAIKPIYKHQLGPAVHRLPTAVHRCSDSENHLNWIQWKANNDRNEWIIFI